MSKEEKEVSDKSGDVKDSRSNRRYVLTTWVLVFSPLLLLISLIFGTLLFGDLPSITELQNPKSSLASVVYSSDGQILGKYYKENRVNVSFSDLDKDIVSALIATEDVRFYEHSGVDIRAVLRSMRGVVTGNSSAGGGSTLTQQLAKMQFPRERLNKFSMIFRKFKEWIIAIRLEKQYTKEEILTMYLNKFDFLNQAVGIKSAANIYCARDQDSLRIEQAALLVGMAKNPSIFNPIHPRRADTALHRRNVVLSQMLKYDFINDQQFDSLKKLPLGLSFQPEDHNMGLAPYFREYLRDHFLEEWCKTHINPETNKPYDIYKDGLRIYSTIDAKMQKYAEEAVAEHMKELQISFFRDCKRKKNPPFAYNVNKEGSDKIITAAMKRSERYRNLKLGGFSYDDIVNNFKTPTPMRIFSWKGDIDTVMAPWDSIRYYKSFLQTGFMACEPQTGYVKAWVGGINHTHFKYDHVRVGARQVGSTFKPFVYAMAIREGYSPCYKVLNTKVCIAGPDGREWCPDNSGGGGSGSYITLRSALAGSVNYISAWIMKQFNPESVIKLVRQMGVTAKIQNDPTICLGTPDISVFEMVGANTTFANKGTYIQTSFVTRIEDKNGKVLEDFIPPSTEVLSEEKAYVMLKLMQGVVDQGTGSRLRWKHNLRNQIAGKTGTTQNNSDGWFIGITPELVAGAWVGAEDRSVHFNSTGEGQGASMALPIWGKFFQKVYEDKSLKVSKANFAIPAALSESEFDCSKIEEDGLIDDGIPQWEKEEEENASLPNN
ncbi:MAG: transglycosylase domain-containing protein [Bacteroidota bacterium]